jgi:hypothetical protein
MEYRVLSMDDTSRAGEMTKGGAKVKLRGRDRGGGRKMLSDVSG